jgi:hypothetical protein
VPPVEPPPHAPDGKIAEGGINGVVKHEHADVGELRGDDDQQEAPNARRSAPRSAWPPPS